MFDLAWSEIALIVVVALIVIGPKDLPTAIKGIAAWIQKGKKMIRDFQSQADDLVKEANLQEVRSQIQDVRSTISDIRNFDLKGMVDKTVDPDGTLKSSLSGMDGSSSSYSTPAWTPPATAANTPGAPAMIPPSTTAPYVPPPPPPTAADLPDAPAFLPPSTLAPPPPPPVVTPAVEEAPVAAPAMAEAASTLPPGGSQPAAVTTTQA
jgi:sec-independent protein translocase protein TatB